MKKKKDLILFVNYVPLMAVKAVEDYAKIIKKELEVAVIKDSHSYRKTKTTIKHLVCDLDKPLCIDQALEPYQERLLAIVCRGDKNVADFAKIIPYVPYLRTPTEKSILWSVDKIEMRRHFYNYDKSITPKFIIVKDDSKQTIKKIKNKLKFPLMIKPSGLGASLWVTNCFHEEELVDALKKIFKHINSTYKKNGREEIPKVLVEEFMEGDLYSVDVYITSRGKISFCPMVQIKTGKEIGFDDFFGYQQMTPTILKQKSIDAAQAVASQAIYALNLRSTSAHVELMKTEDGFKVVELGPRLGGFRHELYELSYDFNHSLNDILVRIPKKLHINKKVRGYSVAMKFFAKKEGRLEKLSGAKKIKQLESFEDIKINKKTGDMCRYAKNGGKSVVNLIMFNKSRSGLLADIRRAEKVLHIIT